MTSMNNKYDPATYNLMFRQIQRSQSSALPTHKISPTTNNPKAEGAAAGEQNQLTAADITRRNKELLIIFKDCGVDLID